MELIRLHQRDLVEVPPGELLQENSWHRIAQVSG